jgi:hypothetical protein
VKIYALLDHQGCPRYVGWSRDPAARVAMHWRHRGKKDRYRQNPALAEWLQGMLLPPDWRVLATVPWADRYQQERAWTVRVAAKHQLLNISYGAAPLHRPPLTAEHRAKIRAGLARRRGGGVRAVAA